jgi:hypothetical protein
VLGTSFMHGKDKQGRQRLLDSIGGNAAAHASLCWGAGGCLYPHMSSCDSGQKQWCARKHLPHGQARNHVNCVLVTAHMSLQRPYCCS